MSKFNVNNVSGSVNAVDDIDLGLIQNEGVVAPEGAATSTGSSLADQWRDSPETVEDVSGAVGSFVDDAFAPVDLRFDDFPFIFLTLILSLQASYAAPLILLAQNRQADRDRIQVSEDRVRNERSIADTEYLTRELASLRNALGEVATRDFLRNELKDMLEEVLDELRSKSKSDTEK